MKQMELLIYPVYAIVRARGGMHASKRAQKPAAHRAVVNQAKEGN
jgi:hypothetical protein